MSAGGRARDRVQSPGSTRANLQPIQSDHTLDVWTQSLVKDPAFNCFCQELPFGPEHVGDGFARVFAIPAALQFGCGLVNEGRKMGTRKGAENGDF